MNISIQQAQYGQKRQLEKRLKAVQFASAIVFLPFLVVHLSNALLGILGPATYDQFQGAAQLIYQIPLIECSFVISPLLMHMVAGVTLLLLKQHQPKHVSLGRRLHTWAGLFLTVVILGHVIATRGLPWANDFHTEFSGVAFSLWWMPWYFYPYYFLLFMAGAYHSLNGSNMLTQRLFSHALITSKRQMQVVMLLAAIMISTALFSFGGNLREDPDPRDNDFARLYQTLFNLEFSR